MNYNVNYNYILLLGVGSMNNKKIRCCTVGSNDNDVDKVTVMKSTVNILITKRIVTNSANRVTKRFVTKSVVTTKTNSVVTKIFINKRYFTKNLGFFSLVFFFSFFSVSVSAAFSTRSLIFLTSSSLSLTLFSFASTIVLLNHIYTINYVKIDFNQPNNLSNYHFSKWPNIDFPKQVTNSL